MLPKRLEQAIQTLAALPVPLKTEALLEYARRLPPVPEEKRGRLEQVHECQTPFFVRAELEEGRVRLYFEVPKEAPTVRAFAGLLFEGLDGETPEAILAVPPGFYRGAGLEAILTPLRLRGLEAALLRLQNQVRALTPPP